MRKKIKYSCVGMGVLRATILTLIFFMIYSGVLCFLPKASENISFNSMFIMVITCLSVLYGAAYAAKKSGEKGWVIGLLVSVIYCLIIFTASVIAGRNTTLGLSGILRIVIALFIGVLSGMLGINL